MFDISKHKTHQVLGWDSEFFQLKTVKLLAHTLGEKQLSELLPKLLKENIKLVYYYSDATLLSEDASRLGGSLVDEKLSYDKSFNTLIIDELIPHVDINIEQYDASVSLNSLEQLAIISGQFSRFSIDKNINKASFEQLYKIWIQQSINGQLADKIWLAKVKNRAIGMIVLAQKEGVGDIRLLAVDPKFRAQGIAQSLLKKAQDYFVKQDVMQAKVVTQGANLAAKNLYKKCGYRLERTQYVYHFWL